VTTPTRGKFRYAFFGKGLAVFLPAGRQVREPSGTVRNIESFIPFLRFHGHPKLLLMRINALFAVVILLTGCAKPTQELKTGTWRGVIELQGHELPFGLEISRNEQGYVANLVNAGEKIILDEISITGDSVDIALHVFDASLKAKINGDRLDGTFVKYYAPQVNQPFHATYGDTFRFEPVSAETTVDFSGKYEVEFKTDKDSYPSVGLFNQNGNHVTGTFLTPTGDYRFLEGNVIDGKLMLSTFDGNHAFLFTAEKSGDSIRGDYYSGKTYHETFRGVRNENAQMPDPESLTYLKPGYERLEFSFKDLNGNSVTSEDPRFKNKVVIYQIFGTWCPNCMDETKFLSSWYEQNKDRDVVIVGLAYERKDDFAYASERVRKMIDKWDVGYDFLIAGVNDKEKAAATLPALNKVLAFPTTIFVGKDGKVKYIHTGFEGPGTGVYHERFKERFNEIVNEMLAEKVNR
jgi:thiol-disulfide isomerase/thioredoxin